MNSTEIYTELYLFVDYEFNLEFPIYALSLKEAIKLAKGLALQGEFMILRCDSPFYPPMITNREYDRYIVSVTL